MANYVNWIEEPVLRQPIMILAMAGWNDASSVATTSVRFLIDHWNAKKFAEVDPEEFFNFMRIRPYVKLDGEGNRAISWPETAFHFHADPLLDRDYVLLIGIEPNIHWRTFCEQILSVATALHVTSVLSLGGLGAQVPHTVEARVTGSTTDPSLARQFPDLSVRRSRYEGPTGIVGVLSDMCNRSGIPTASLWGNVPHYISASPNPKVSHGLLRRLSTMYNLGLNLDDLARSGRRFERQVSEALSHNPELAQYVKQLEAAQTDVDPPDEQLIVSDNDDTVGSGELPKAEDVVRQLEEFLRQGRQPGPTPGTSDTDED